MRVFVQMVARAIALELAHEFDFRILCFSFGRDLYDVSAFALHIASARKFEVGMVATLLLLLRLLWLLRLSLLLC